MTSFDDVISVALFKFRDRDLAEMEVEDRDAVMSYHLFNAAAHAQTVTEDSSFEANMTDREFAADLNNEQISILATGIAYEWYNSKVFNSETIRNRLSNKDYSNHSPGTLLESMTKLRARGVQHKALHI